jgi:hypothetical protein
MIVAPLLPSKFPTRISHVTYDNIQERECSQVDWVQSQICMEIWVENIVWLEVGVLLGREMVQLVE